MILAPGSMAPARRYRASSPAACRCGAAAARANARCARGSAGPAAASRPRWPYHPGEKRLLAAARLLGDDLVQVGQLAGAFDLRMRRENLLEQGRTRARQTDDEDHLMPQAGVAWRRQPGRGVAHARRRAARTGQRAREKAHACVRWRWPVRQTLPGSAHGLPAPCRVRSPWRYDRCRARPSAAAERSARQYPDRPAGRS